MVTKQYVILFIIFGLFLLMNQSTRSYAYSTTPETMMSCEALLEKSSSAVLAKFGPPDTAEVVPKDSRTTGPGSSIVNNEPELLVWTYKKVNPPNLLEFTFSNKVLISVEWQPVVWSADMISQVSTDTQTLIKTYERASLKLGYAGTTIELRETTQNGHLARFFCLTNVPPLANNHVFNPSTGLYSDITGPNPSFLLSQEALGRLDAMILTNGKGETYEADAKELKGRGTAITYLSRLRDDRLKRGVFGVFSSFSTIYTYIPITSSNMPWLY